MFKTPKALFEVQQLLSCSRIRNNDRPLSSSEKPLTIRGRRRAEGRREGELFETSYALDMKKLRETRKISA